MRVLLLLIVGLAGCGGGASQDAATFPSGMASAPVADTEAVLALKNLGAAIKGNQQGDVVEVYFADPQINDAGLVHLREFPKLKQIALHR